MNVVNWLKLPEVKEIEDVDSPYTSVLHGQIIRRKGFLRKLYIDFYSEFKEATSTSGSRRFIELGSGGGFIKKVIPNVVTSDIMCLPNLDLIFSTEGMPFRNNTVDAFFMLDVLHHICDPSTFFEESSRCLKNGGKIVMIEPASTLWGRLIYRNFHHESFNYSADWNLQNKAPLSSANGAISWIIFFRDRKMFSREFPALKIKKLKFHTPLRYLLSGGVSMRQLLPPCTYKLVKAIEFILSPFNKYIGMFLTIELEKV